MKCLIFFAIVALVSAEEKKPVKEEEKKPIDDNKHGLQWPLPDPISEGDLMLHGSISYDRVRALHKAKLEDDVDKMILAHGRLFLRRVSKFFEENEKDFKIMPVFCRDTKNLNGSSHRWRIEIPKIQQQAPVDEKDQVKQDQPLPKDKNDKPEEVAHNNITGNENETTIAPSSSAAPIVSSSSFAAPSTERPSSEKPSSEKPSSERPSSERPSSEKPTDKPSDKPSTTVRPPIEQPAQEKETYEVRRREFYRQVGANFARLLMKEYRKEQLVEDEKEYLAHWIADEAVHYGAAAIFCNENENVKEIKKQLAIWLEEKP